MSEPSDLTRALLAEVATKADLVWVEVPGIPARGMWHGWHEGVVLLVTGGIEQPDPGLIDGGTVRLLLRSKDTQTRVLSCVAQVRHLTPDSSDWASAVQTLHPKRWNPPDGEAQPERWRTDSDVWQLVPTTDIDESPGAMSDVSHRAEPMRTPATTSGHQPFHAGKATRRRRT